MKKILRFKRHRTPVNRCIVVDGAVKINIRRDRKEYWIVL